MPSSFGSVHPGLTPPFDWLSLIALVLVVVSPFQPLQPFASQRPFVLHQEPINVITGIIMAVQSLLTISDLEKFRIIC